jgi:hypothetical protein
MFSKAIRSAEQKRTIARAALGVTSALTALTATLAACSAVHDESNPSAESAQAGSAQALEAAPALPSPRAFASMLDLECHRSVGQPPVLELGIRQLNPVLKDVLPNQQIQLGPMLETCLPVAKNLNTPPAGLLEFMRWVDVACYRAEAAPVNVPVTLSHLNPKLQDLPDESVILTQLRRFCSPVRKNFSDIPAAVRRVVEHIDFACYQFQAPTPPANRNLRLTHLNPVVRAFGFPDRIVRLEQSGQLCVPVAKNQQPVPEDVKRIVEWIDLKSYDITLLAGAAPAFPLVLQQMNPLFAGAPLTFTTLYEPTRLMVPVAKNHVLPPAD